MHDEHASAVDPLEPLPFITGQHTDSTLTQSLFGHVWAKPGKAWYAALAIAACGVGLLVVGIVATIGWGIGTWGNNIPVGWAFGIVNFVWWVGIGHAGTLISAILFLFQQKWRTAINRFAEAMTIFAVMCAGIFPALHTGRPWFDYFLFPYPSDTLLWPQFKSPLTWDVFAVSTYFTVSLLYWYLGLIPDLAALRDASTSKTRRIVYGIFSLGWRGSGRHWHNYKIGYLLLAGLATPLVLSVHTTVSFDFAVSLLPGWHTTIFPPYFVAGAVYSGFAMVITFMIPARHFLNLKHVITKRHIENMCKVLLVTGNLVAYGYMMEHFMAWYSGSVAEWDQFFNRMTGHFWYMYAIQMACNVALPQIFWFKWARQNLVVIWIASLFVNLGMWAERFVIIVMSLHHSFLPSMFKNYAPSWVDWSLFLGTMGFFTFMMLLFMKFLPAVAVSEVKELNHELAHAHVRPEANPRQTGA